MTRLFTALWPSADAVAGLGAEVSGTPRGSRCADPATWHVTLAFHGEADAGVLARRLDAAAYGSVAPRLRLAGAGAFPGVRWAGVQAEPASALEALVAAAGGDVGRFVPHVTVLRLRPRPGPDPDPAPPTPWSTHVGPWWRPPDVRLVASEPTRGGMRYRIVHRVPLRSWRE